MSDPIRDLRQQLLAAAERQHAGVESAGARPRPSPLRRRLLLVAAALPIAAAVALVSTTPWKTAPDFLERAQAALTPPEESILHMKWELSRTSADYGCKVTVGPSEMWVDQAPPYAFRLVDLNAPPSRVVDRRTIACTIGDPVEVGGSLEEWLRFAPATLTYNGPGFGGMTDFPAVFRDAIASGEAHAEGRTQLDGRTVERVRFDAGCPAAPCPARAPSYAYVDPVTFAPVQLEIPYGDAIVSPLDGKVLRFHVVRRFLSYEYLPRTDANRALTDMGGSG